MNQDDHTLKAFHCSSTLPWAPSVHEWSHRTTIYCRICSSVRFYPIIMCVAGKKDARIITQKAHFVAYVQVKRQTEEVHLWGRRKKKAEMNYCDMCVVIHSIDFSLEWLIEFVRQSWWELTSQTPHHTHGRCSHGATLLLQTPFPSFQTRGTGRRVSRLLGSNLTGVETVV